MLLMLVKLIALVFMVPLWLIGFLIGFVFYSMSYGFRVASHVFPITIP